MKTIIFAVAGYNLAETSRMVEIARAAKEHFNILFLSYGGQFETLIERDPQQLRTDSLRFNVRAAWEYGQ